MFLLDLDNNHDCKLDCIPLYQIKNMHLLFPHIEVIFYNYNIKDNRQTYLKFYNIDLYMLLLLVQI